MKYSVRIDLKTSSDPFSLPIRFRISYGGIRPELRLGFSVERAIWDETESRVKKGSVNRFGQTAKDINRAIEQAVDELDRIFLHYQRLHDRQPSASELRQEFYEAINRLSAKEINPAKNFSDLIKEFIVAESAKNNWNEDTAEKFEYMRDHWIKYGCGKPLNELTEEDLTGWLRYFEKNKIRNTTSAKYVSLFRWFLRWCYRKGHYKGNLHETFRPKLKGSEGNIKEVIYLEWEELMAVYNLQFAESEKYLERARDVFCFCCFSGLRYSDVAKLGKQDLRGDSIRVVTKKTSDGIHIALNNYTRAIIEKYKKDLKGVTNVLPVISNQKMNDYIKIVSRRAGITQPIRSVYFIGNKRYEDVTPKCDLITSHAGRRTFVVTAITLGISESVIIEWTGHSDFKALKPYKKVVSSLKLREMKKFDEKFQP
jgi:integrase